MKKTTLLLALALAALTTTSCETLVKALPQTKVVYQSPNTGIKYGVTFTEDAEGNKKPTLDVDISEVEISDPNVTIEPVK